MKERPILFSAPMVRALLAGTKTQTRRIVNPQPNEDGIADDVDPCPPYSREWKGSCGGVWKCPYGQVGDQSWVKETFLAQAYGCDDLTIRYTATPDAYSIHGAADGSVPDEGLVVYYRMFDKSRINHGKPVSYPSIFMPRWASRIQLEITAVRVERLQDISESDAKSEGCELYLHSGYDFEITTRPAIANYRRLWNSLSLDPEPVFEKQADGKKRIVSYYSFPWCVEDFDAKFPGVRAAGVYRGNPIEVTPNPWLWVIEFRRIKP